MKRLALVIILLCAVFPLLFFSQATAQTDKPKCDPASVIAKAAALKTGGNSDADMKALTDLGKDVQKMHAICNGQVLSGKGNKVTTPFMLKAGAYRLSVETKGTFRATALSSEGDKCLLDWI